MCIKFILSGHMEFVQTSFILGWSKIASEFLMSILCFILNMNKNCAQIINY